MKKRIFLFLGLFLLFSTVLWAQAPRPQATPPYYPDQPSYPNAYGANPYSMGSENYNDMQRLLQKREMFRQAFGVNTLNLGKEEAYFFLVGQFSLFLPYFLFSLPQPQIALFSLASMMLTYP